MRESSAGITALVPTFNEEDNIRACLEHLTWVDQLIVVDSFSTDRTLEIAREFTDEVVQHEYVNSATQKNWALSTLPLRGRWTLIVDADERIVPELAEEILRVVIDDDRDYGGYFLNRRNYFFGHWIRHAGMYPSWNLRLFRTGAARYETKEVDADVYLLEPGRVGYLKHDMEHYSFRSIQECVRKFDRYAGWDAHERAKPPAEQDDQAEVAGALGGTRTWARRVFEKLPAKPVVIFLYMYFLKLGFLDGRAGFVTCGLWAVREFLTEAKLWELRQAQLHELRKARSADGRRG
ncbi:MAG TPA: glycosyltransferase family 2 protein [Armatimonadota bacterium]|jgi:glycosyltransferase involved in cell wall biosynthesis